MPHPYTLPEALKAVGSLKPAADAAGRTGRYVSVKTAHKAYVVFHIDQGNAATIALSITQAQAVAGTGAKAGPSTRWWACLDIATSDQLVRQADGASFTTDAGVKEKIVVAEVEPASLDMANGFDCFAPTTGASNVANLTQATIYLVERYPGATQPAATVD